MVDTSFLGGRITLKPGDCREFSGAATSARALEVGKAAEHLVCADLIMSGYRAFLSDQGLPYDVIVDHGGRIIKVQVKATVKARTVPGRPNLTKSYFFQVRHAGRGNKRIVSTDDFDVLALVALDIKAAAYVRFTDKVLQTIHIRPPGTAHHASRKVWKNIDEMPFEQAILGLL